MLTVIFAIFQLTPFLPTNTSVPTITPTPTLAQSSDPFISSLTILPIILSIINVVILAYTLKINKDNSGFSRWVNTIKQSILSMNVVSSPRLQITIANYGEVPIDSISVEAEGIINTEKEQKTVYKKTFDCTSIIMKSEKTYIDLDKDFEKFLLAEDFINQHFEDVPTGETDWLDDEPIYYKETYTHIRKPFTINLSLKTTYKVHNTTKTIAKKYSISYDFIDGYGDPNHLSDYDCQYSDNYEINIYEERWTSR